MTTNPNWPEIKEALSKIKLNRKEAKSLSPDIV